MVVIAIARAAGGLALLGDMAHFFASFALLSWKR
jgi:hypothetical protein